MDKLSTVISDPETQLGLLSGAVAVKDLTAVLSNGAKNLFGNAEKVVISEASTAASASAEVGEGTVLADRSVADTGTVLLEGVAKGETTTLYRAVSQAELEDISQNGFQMGNNAMGNKWFAESAADAAAWGQKFFKWDKEPVWTLKVNLPKSTADSLMRKSNLDGIGPARSVDVEQLNADIKVLMGNVLKN